MARPPIATRSLPDWRSVHFIPANVPRYLEKASSLAADAFQIDLEDSVPQAAKAACRKNVPNIAARLKLSNPGTDVLVRINRPMQEAVRDIESVVCADVDVITLTKVDGVSHVRLIDELVDECEQACGLPQGHTAIMVVIETARAFEAMRDIALASPRIVAMMLGTEDFALSCGAAPDDEVMLMPKQHMIIAARAAGIVPLGYIGSIAAFRNPAQFRDMVYRSKAFGFVGGTSVHPAQIPILNEVYGPSQREIETSTNILNANAQALAEGRGSFEVAGYMVDAPIVERARLVLERARRFGLSVPH